MLWEFWQIKCVNGTGRSNNSLTKVIILATHRLSSQRMHHKRRDQRSMYRWKQETIEAFIWKQCWRPIPTQSRPDVSMNLISICFMGNRKCHAADAFMKKATRSTDSQVQIGRNIWLKCLCTNIMHTSTALEYARTEGED